MGVLEDLRSAFESGGGFEEATDLMKRYGADDFVSEYPQSGERLNQAALKKMDEQYTAATGSEPKFTFRRSLSGDDIFVIEGTNDYGDGVPVRYVGVGELRDGKIAKMTEYFANPFEAPEWRAPFVERFEP